MTIDVVIGTAVAALAAFEAWITYAGERVLKSYFTLTHAIATAVLHRPRRQRAGLAPGRRATLLTRLAKPGLGISWIVRGF